MIPKRFVINKLLLSCTFYQAVYQLVEALTSSRFYELTQPDRMLTWAINHRYN